MLAPSNKPMKLRAGAGVELIHWRCSGSAHGTLAAGQVGPQLIGRSVSRRRTLYEALRGE